ncbi:transmembrane protein 144-like isoform X2 [Corticium candelabrum]|uniref:transmembrane protein 144-like isoform X2 n=1 Tax=Corticium candelabrum TaxID=121492 RepID=UPI002E276C12|nr:transmembrane protein 144-like isoform X2 [Corticium candelabrum]
MRHVPIVNAAVACCFICLAAGAVLSAAERTGLYDYGNSTSNQCGAGASSQKVHIGFIAAAIAVIFFGSQYLPVKKFDTGDGIFFQWIMCIAIWICGLVVNLVISYSPPQHMNVTESIFNGHGRTPFQPLAMLGGFFWATGNVLCVPIVKCIGMGMGVLVWGTINCLGGWASDRFGWFGLHAAVPKNNAENFAGVAMCILGVTTFFFVKSEGKVKKTIMDEEESVLSPHSDIQLPITKKLIAEEAIEEGDKSWVDNLSSTRRRVVGFGLAIIAGSFFSVNFDPVTYLQQNCDNSQDGLYYVFSHFCGILLTSTVYMLIYCVVMRNRPQVISQTVLPAMVSGVLWAVADTSWFVANANLTQTVSFPIVATAPGVVSALWGVILFREVKGLRNLLVLTLACCITVSGVILTALSKT